MDDLNEAMASMKRRVKRYVDETLEKHKARETAKQGTIRGDRLVYGNRSYHYIPVEDEYFEDGSTVWFLLDSSGTTAIVVGYKTRIRSLYPGGAIDSSGKKLSFIGNLPVEEGDEVWTDGTVIFGNEHIKGESFLTSADGTGIPVVAVKNDEGFMGFIRKNGRRKKALRV